METTPNLSGAQRAYMNGPEAFRRRMQRRAEELFADGYRVEPGEEIGLSIKPGAANFFDAATGLAFAA